MLFSLCPNILEVEDTTGLLSGGNRNGAITPSAALVYALDLEQEATKAKEKGEDREEDAEVQINVLLKTPLKTGMMQSLTVLRVSRRERLSAWTAALILNALPNLQKLVVSLDHRPLHKRHGVAMAVLLEDALKNPGSERQVGANLMSLEDLTLLSTDEKQIEQVYRLWYMPELRRVVIEVRCLSRSSAEVVENFCVRFQDIYCLSLSADASTPVHWKPQAIDILKAIPVLIRFTCSQHGMWPVGGSGAQGVCTTTFPYLHTVSVVDTSGNNVKLCDVLKTFLNKDASPQLRRIRICQDGRELREDDLSDEAKDLILRCAGRSICVETFKGTGFNLIHPLENKWVEGKVEDREDCIKGFDRSEFKRSYSGSFHTGDPIFSQEFSSSSSEGGSSRELKRARHAEH